MKVLFLDTVHPTLEQRLTRAGMTCVDATSIPTHSAIQAHSDAQGLVLRGRIQVDSNVLNVLPELRFICRSGAGLETSTSPQPSPKESAYTTALKATVTP